MTGVCTTPTIAPATRPATSARTIRWSGSTRWQAKKSGGGWEGASTSRTGARRSRAAGGAAGLEAPLPFPLQLLRVGRPRGARPDPPGAAGRYLVGREAAVGDDA